MKKAFTFFFLISMSVFTIEAQTTQKFNQALLDLSQNKITKAAEAFNEMYQHDSINMNYAYLLGQCYAILGTDLDYAIYLLEKASKKYSPNYQPRSPQEINVSEYVYYYLLMAYSKNGNCDKTLPMLNKFYGIYSFSNEYYLVEGQRFHRECVPKKSIEKVKEKPIFETTQDSNWVSTKSINYTNKQPTYGVQIAATLQPKYTWEFKNVKNVEVFVDENGIYRYIIGKFVSPIAAEKLLETIVEAGYPDAFVVNIKDKTKFAEKVVNMNNKPISEELVGKVVFRVQIGAFRSDTVPEDLGYLFMELDSISEINDGQWTYLTVGEFTSLEDARFYLELIKDIGVKDAFITAFNYNRKITLKQAEFYLLEENNQKEEHNKKKKRSRN